MIRFGPSGGILGEPFFARHLTAAVLPSKRPGPAWRIAQIKGSAGDFVYQLEVVWVSSQGEVDSSIEVGTDAGGGTFEFSIDPGDVLTRLTGTLNWGSFNHPQVSSIQFGTANDKASPVYGNEWSKYSFSYTSPNGFHIVGLHGRASDAIDARGVYIDDRPPVTGSK
jgi:hypothetical protein